MPIAICFWVLWLMWAIFGAVPMFRGKDWSGSGTTLLPLIVVALLGWSVFGPVLK
jgi:hypothetical protein